MQREIKPYNVYLGDSIELMRDIPDSSVHMICTDPPYGVAYKSNMAAKGFQKERIQNDKHEDWLDLLPRMFKQYKRILMEGGDLTMFCGGGYGGNGQDTPSLPNAWMKCQEYLTMDNVVVWDRCDIGLGVRYRPVWDAILVAYKGETRRCWNGGLAQSNILRYPRIIPQAGEHPTPKPVALMGKLVSDNTDEGDIVLDPFCGGGPTLEAAHILKRQWIGIDLEPNYVNMSNRRMEPILAQGVLF